MPIPKKTKSVSPYFTEDAADQIRAAVNAVGTAPAFVDDSGS
jgi:inosine/xanthosine triphosphate pyrophosphatase family protein